MFEYIVMIVIYIWLPSFLKKITLLFDYDNHLFAQLYDIKYSPLLKFCTWV